uniref:Kinesin-like protein n=1 Tax=Rhabditophanes sp. KR3021 TaxID=114890 RepID=A0AC35UBK0_9BILA
MSAESSDSFEVVCRLRPCCQSQENVLYLDDEHVRIVTPSDKIVKASPESLFKFGHVFDGDATQKSVFKRTCENVIKKLLHGENGLLFTYGVTCSGKTHTISGTKQDSGILPRVVDVLFNSIPKLADKCIFTIKEKNVVTANPFDRALYNYNNLIKERSYVEMQKLSLLYHDQQLESLKIKVMDKGEISAIFISYMELYNQQVFDLFDEEGSARKDLRTDSFGTLYCENLIEHEVSCTAEVLAYFNKAQERRKTAQTALNDTSSRSHSIFTVRLVKGIASNYAVGQASITQSQLFLVDLAGSERAKRTNACKERLNEANAINNSLLTLRRCFDALRNNQTKKNKILPPYRENKLTLLFKSFFEGKGSIKMIVCINPREEDFEENIHVLGFAEVSQEVELCSKDKTESCKPISMINGNNYSRHDIVAWHKEAETIFKSQEYGLIKSLTSQLNSRVWEICKEAREHILVQLCEKDLLALKFDALEEEKEDILALSQECKTRINEYELEKKKYKMSVDKLEQEYQDLVLKQQESTTLLKAEPKESKSSNVKLPPVLGSFRQRPQSRELNSTLNVRKRVEMFNKLAGAQSKENMNDGPSTKRALVGKSYTSCNQPYLKSKSTTANIARPKWN